MGIRFAVANELDPLNKYLKKWTKKHLAKTERFAEIFYLDIYRSDQDGFYPLALLVTAQNYYEFAIASRSGKIGLSAEAAKETFLAAGKTETRTAASLLIEEKDVRVTKYSWLEFSQAKWDAESQSLTFYLRDRDSFSALYSSNKTAKQLRYSSLVGPDLNFMNCVNEGISSTVVYSSPLSLPSGLEITAQILRDGKRNFLVFPASNCLADPLDQHFLSEKYLAWEEQLGIKL